MDRGPLQCKQYVSKMTRWPLAREDAEVREYIQNSGLGHLERASYKIANRVVVSAFVERWHPETNTFHMSFGEMTITLDDVQQMLGINVVGKAMQEFDRPQVGLISELLGISVADVDLEIAHNRTQTLRTQWIIDHLARDGQDRAANVTHEQVATGYLLVLLGCTLFQDRTGDKVQIKYIAYLQYLNKVHEWAWGAGLLAYTYRMLGKASTFESKASAGYLTLLEAWVYEHFPRQRLGKPFPLLENMQRTKQWRCKTKSGIKDAERLLRYMRCELDNMKVKSVVWTPYRAIGEDPEVVSWFSGCLVMDNITEPYHPNRVVRQFGRVQDKPSPPIRPRIASRKKTKAYVVEYDNRAEDYEQYTHHLIPIEDRGPRAKKHGQCTLAYTKWYNSVAIRRLDYGIPSSMFASGSNEEIEGGLKKKIIDVLERLVKDGLKMTKKELHKCHKAALDLVKHGKCTGSDAVDSGEASSKDKGKGKKTVDKKKGKVLEDKRKGKVLEDKGKRKG